MNQKRLAPLVILTTLIAFGAAFASEGFDGLVKLARSGVSEEVMIEFIKRSPSTFDMNKEEKLYLTDLGVSTDVLIAAIEHDKSLMPVVPPPATPTLAAEGVPPVERSVAENTDAPPVPVPAPPVVQPPAPPEHLTVSYFYESLAPYGTWVDTGGVQVWRPAVAVANPEWRPYSHCGHWVLTDAGWAWESDYSWGWAPFHYGRWDLDPIYGWVWTPDTVWAPAWVSWRTCDAYFGWAPLPRAAVFVEGVGFGVGVDFSFGLGEADFFFVPAPFFYEPVLWSYRIRERAEFTLIYRRTTIIHNNITIVNNRVVNNGPSRELAERVTGREIKALKMAGATHPGESNHHESGRDAMQIYRPDVSKETPMSVSQATERHEKALCENIAKRNDWQNKVTDDRQKWVAAQHQKREDTARAEAAHYGTEADEHENKAREMDLAAKDGKDKEGNKLDKDARKKLRADAEEHRKQAEESRQKKAEAEGKALAFQEKKDRVLGRQAPHPHVAGTEAEIWRERALNDIRKHEEAVREAVANATRRSEAEHREQMQALRKEQSGHAQRAAEHEQSAEKLRKQAESETDQEKRTALQAQANEHTAKAAEFRQKERTAVNQQTTAEEGHRGAVVQRGPEQPLRSQSQTLSRPATPQVQKKK